MQIQSGWFSVRCVFRLDAEDPATYEERVTVWKAASFAEAVALAEADAVDYATDVDGEYLGLAQAYAMADELGHGAEVFSLLRDSSLEPDDYMDAFFDTGSERAASTLGTS
ncbi:hypothetical protein AB0G04_33570 [Actinoplanes sp. NPDC023801]|uniref:hypothetical protein n=1 Tax=Actinoplanes sp. NPDC023801 TaxID=3154595 RepID=UPI0033D20C59